MKRKNKLKLFYFIVALLFMVTPVFVVLVYHTNETLKSEIVEGRLIVAKNSSLSDLQKRQRFAEIDKKELFLKSKKNLWIRGAILFSLTATGLLLYKSKMFPNDEVNNEPNK